MMKRYKFTERAAALAMTLLCAEACAYADAAQNQLTVYAGPQSIAPEKTIFVTVEVTDDNGQNLHNEAVELSYVSDGRCQTLTGITRRGLVSFEVPAQKRAGLMRFSAKVTGSAARQAYIVVTASAPQMFTLSVKPAERGGHVAIGSSVIADMHGNSISDFSLITLDWMGDDGVAARQSVQPVKGRIAVSVACPTRISGALKLRASIYALQVSTPDISRLCRAKEG